MQDSVYQDKLHRSLSTKLQEIINSIPKNDIMILLIIGYFNAEGGNNNKGP